MGNYLVNSGNYGVAPQTLENRKQIVAWLNKQEVIEAVKNSLASNVSPELFLKAMKSLANLGNFDDVSRESIYTALIEAAKTGLVPSTGRVYFIPRNNRKTGRKELNFQIGYQGYLDLMRRGGFVCYAGVVYKDDEFEVRQGTKPGIKHKPKIDGERKPEDVIAAYAVAIVGDSKEKIFEVMNRAEIERIRLNYSMGASPAWKNGYAEMCKKTAVMRLRKYCPIDASANEAIVADERRIFGDGEPVKTQTSGATQLKKALGIAPKQVESPFVRAIQNATSVEELDEVFESATVGVDSGEIDADEYETVIRELSERKRVLEPGTFGGRYD